MLRRVYEALCCYQDGIQVKKRLNMLMKEMFRKAIHISSAFVPLLLKAAYLPTLILLAAALVLYCVCEFFRCHNKPVPLVSTITAAAARKRDENRFVLGPVTLVLGILIAAIVFPLPAATVGIWGLAFGDGLASLVGKLFGRIRIPFSGGKTVAGSLACFAAIFCSTFILSGSTRVSLACALVGMGIELLPLKDFDNLIIPLIISGLCHFYFHL